MILFCHPSHRNSSSVSRCFILKIKKKIMIKKINMKKNHIHGGSRDTRSPSAHRVGEGAEAQRGKAAPQRGADHPAPGVNKTTYCQSLPYAQSEARHTCLGRRMTNGVRQSFQGSLTASGRKPETRGAHRNPGANPGLRQSCRRNLTSHPQAQKGVS